MKTKILFPEQAFLLCLMVAVMALSAVVDAQRNQNPCLGKSTDKTFVNDWASCGSYFWCNFLVAVPTTPCPDTFGFHEVDQTCSRSFEQCEDCPEEGILAVGIITNADCTSYTFCRNGVRDEAIITCGNGLRFNRVTGVCDLKANVRCFSTGGDECVIDGVKIDGDISSPESCSKFIQCDKGVNSGTFSCGTGLQFNPVTRSCDLPANIVPPCIDPKSLGDRLNSNSHSQFFRKNSFRDVFLKNTILKVEK